MKMSSTAYEVFIKVQENVRELVQTKPPIHVHDAKVTKGIYMLYVDDFSDERVLPIYVGRGTNKKGVQGRYRDHMLPIIALNRYSSEDYEHLIIETSIVDGRYLYPKIVKYMCDHGLALGMLKCILLEECEEIVVSERESYWMNYLHAQFLGFNQVDSVTTFPDLFSSDESSNTAAERQLLESDLANCEKFFSYGYTRFNFRYVLDQWFFLLDREDSHKRVRDIDSEGDSARAKARLRANAWIKRARDNGRAEYGENVPQQMLYTKMMLEFDMRGLIPGWFVELRHTWRRDLLPSNMSYTKYPLGDLFSAEKWWLAPKPDTHVCVVRFELSARSAACGKVSATRAKPQIIWIDYAIGSQTDGEKFISGGSFIDCDITRKLSDSKVHNRLKAELLKGSITKYDWETWMCVPELEGAEESAYLWSNAIGETHGDWNRCGPTYTLKAELASGINGYSMKGCKLKSLSEVLSHVFQIVAQSKCILIVQTNAVKKAVLDAITEQGGFFALELQQKTIWYQSVPRPR